MPVLGAPPLPPAGLTGGGLPLTSSGSTTLLGPPPPLGEQFKSKIQRAHARPRIMI
jgi:hypothetical protein